MSKKSKRLVIFGCGYVGSAVARYAVEHGWLVTALTRNEDQARKLKAWGVDTVVVADLTTSDWHDAIAPQQDFLLHCVSSGRAGIHAYKSAYIDGTQSILDWAVCREIGTSVFTSSTSVYPQDGGEWVGETAPLVGVGERGTLMQEAERLFFEGSFGRRFVLRLAGIYGPGRHYLLDQLRSGVLDFAGFGDHYLNLIYLDDIVAGIWKIFHAPSTLGDGVYNLADDEPTPKAEVLAWIAKRWGFSEPRFAGLEVDDGGMRSRRRNKWGRVPNRRICNKKFKESFDWGPGFPSFREGYEDIWEK